MPQAANIILKNDAGTDKTFTLYTPAAGDGGWAQWRLKEGAVTTAFPSIAALARATPNVARKVQVKLQIPSSYVDTSSGLTITGPKFDFEARVTVPDNFPENMKDDAVAYVKNLVAHAIIQAMLRDGLPAV